MIDNIGSSLVQYKPGTTTIVPDLALNWTISPDGLTYTFTMRQNAKFSNGDPINASTIIFSWKRAMSIGAAPSDFLTGHINNSDPNSLQAPSAYQLVVHLEGAFAPFTSILSVSGAPVDIVDPKLVGANTTFNGPYIGSGPYMVSTFTPGVELDLTANPSYYGTPPLTKNIQVKFFNDPSTLAIALQSKQLDVALGTLAPADISLFRANPNLKVDEVPGTEMRFIAFNTLIPPFNNTLLRQALAYAINRTTFINSVFLGTVSPAYSIIPSLLNGSVPVYKSVYGPDGNLTKAKQILAQLGYNSTNQLNMQLWYTPTEYGTTEVSVVTILQQEFQATGMIKVTLNSAEFSTYLSLYFNKVNLPTLMVGWFPDYIDADDYVFAMYNSHISHFTGTWYNNTQVDNLIAQEEATTNLTLRLSDFAQIQNITATATPLVPLWQQDQVVVTQNYVSGPILDASQIPRFYTISASS